MTRYGFIGTGSMGSMLIRHFIRTGVVAPQDIAACSKTGVSARALATETGISVKDSDREVAQDADVLFICVRPLDVHGVLAEIRDVLSKNTLLVSIAGCVTLADLAAWSVPGARCVKIIPSVTAEEHSGISLVAWGSWVTPEDKELVFSLFSAIGTPVEIEERHIEVYSDLTSCAPALFAAMMQEYAMAARTEGGCPPGPCGVPCPAYPDRDRVAPCLERDGIRYNYQPCGDPWRHHRGGRKGAPQQAPGSLR